MTLSIGNVVRKVNPDDNDKFVEGEQHIIFKVTQIVQGYNPDTKSNDQFVKVEPIR